MNAMLARPYRPPEVAVKLGTVLDLVVEDRDVRLFLRDWGGWQLLTDEDGMEREPGRARLYLFAGKLELDGELEPDDLPEAAATHVAWNQREADKVGTLREIPDEIGWYQGRVLEIGYRSDKWARKGKTHDYHHIFTEHGAQPPRLYTNTKNIDRARAAVITGGDMSVTPEGID